MKKERLVAAPHTFMLSVLLSGNERQNGANPHEYRVFDLSLCLVILV